MIGLMCSIYFLRVNFKFKIKVCNGCHDLMQKAMSFIDAAIASVRRNNYEIRFWHMSGMKPAIY